MPEKESHTIKNGVIATFIGVILFSFWGSIQNSVSRFIILNQPLKVAEVETSSENGLSGKLVGGAGFSWSGFTKIFFFIKQSTYQRFPYPAFLQKYCQLRIVRDQLWIGIVHFLLAF